MVTTLAVVTATVFGVMVGVEFAVAVFVGPILRRLPVGSWIEASADGARVLGRVMPFWYIGSLLLTAWLAAAKSGGPAGDAAAPSDRDGRNQSPRKGCGSQGPPSSASRARMRVAALSCRSRRRPA